MLRQAAKHSGLAERDGELHVVLVDGATITSLNEEHLGHEGTTDVITFDLSGDPPLPGEQATLGEIYVCLDVAGETGARLGTGIGYETVLYCIHGMLHLAGLDDHKPADRRKMRAAEARIMAELRDIRDFRDIL
jgi:probable rRNA maturation factor